MVLDTGTKENFREFFFSKFIFDLFKIFRIFNLEILKTEKMIQKTIETHVEAAKLEKFVKFRLMI